MILQQLITFAIAINPRPIGKKGMVSSKYIDKIIHAIATKATITLNTVQKIFFVSFMFVFSFEIPVRSL